LQGTLITESSRQRAEIQGYIATKSSLEEENFILTRELRKTDSSKEETFSSAATADQSKAMSADELLSATQARSSSPSEYRRGQGKGLSAHDKIGMLAELSTADELALERWSLSKDKAASMSPRTASRGRGGPPDLSPVPFRGREAQKAISEKDKRALAMWGS